MNLMKTRTSICQGHVSQSTTNFSTGGKCGSCKKSKKNMRANEEIRGTLDPDGLIGQLFCGRCITAEKERILTEKEQKEKEKFEDKAYLKRLTDKGQVRIEKEKGKREEIFLRLHKEKKNIGKSRDTSQLRDISRK